MPRVTVLTAALMAALIFGAAWHFYSPAHRPSAFQAAAPDSPEIKSPTLKSPVVAEAPVSKPASWNIVGALPNEIEIAKTIVAHFQAGNYGKALAILENDLNQAAEVRKISPAYRQWSKDQLPILLLSQGWLLLKQGQCEQAVTLLARSENLRGGPEATKGLAVCFYKLHDIPSAADKFAVYLAAKPSDWDAQLLYVDALESEQRFGEASSILEKLVKDLPDIDPKLQAEIMRRRDRMAAKSRESFRQSTTGSRHFVVIFRAEEHRELAAYITEVLERSHDEFAANFGTVTLTSPVEVALYPSREFARLAGGPPWADGLFDGRIRIPVPSANETMTAAVKARLTRVIRHELLHAILAIHSDYRNLPTWFNEGLAQTIECENQRCPFDVFPPMPGVMLDAVAFDRAFTELSATAASQAYMQSRYLVAVLFRDFGDDAVRKIVESLAVQGNPSSDGILRPLGIDFANLLSRAAQSWKLRQVLSQTP